MTDSLISSADFSDLSDMVDDLIVSTPVCPICRNNFSRRVKPMTVQPCGHSLCSSCLTELDSHIQLDEDGRPIPSKCPTCRGAIEKSTPNWSLREITCNVNNDQVTGFWEKQIIGLDIAKGRKIAFSREMRPYAKVICMRIAYDEVIVNIKLGPGDWTREQIEAMQVSNLPKTSLHETDVKFISETVKVVSAIDGANEMKLRVHDKLPSVFSITIFRPPKMSPDDLKQLQMLNNRLKRIRFDFNKNRLLLESWKHKKEPVSKKRTREDDVYEYDKLPSTYNLEMVDKMDIKHVSGIISYFVSSTEMEFNLAIHTDVSSYRLLFTNIEIFEIKTVELLIKKYGAFVSNIYFDFPKSTLELSIRRNDCPLNTITTVRPRKRVKIQ
eukprot:g7869.t1